MFDWKIWLYKKESKDKEIWDESPLPQGTVHAELLRTMVQRPY